MAVSFGLIPKNQNQIDFEFDFDFTIWKICDDINLLNALAVTEGIDNLEVVDNPLSFNQCKDLDELN